MDEESVQRVRGWKDEIPGVDVYLVEKHMFENMTTVSLHIVSHPC